MAAVSMHEGERDIAFGLIFFSSSEVPLGADKYRLVIESAKFADQHGFSSVWIPERHFTKDGWLYPNPAVLHAALARETRRIHLRAGSVVMPLHNPIRVAEEWAMVDNLSGGRVGISFASGWHPNDFVFFPEHYADRNAAMYRGIQTVQKLWRGETIQVKGGDGKLAEIRTYPTPIQPELPIWITAAGNPKTFIGAGEIGANLLTHLFNQSIEELAEKIRLYREAREKHGYDPQAGQVSVMVHTFVGEHADHVHEQARTAFCTYLKSASYLLSAIAYSRGQKVDLASLSEQDAQDYLYFVFDRLISTHRVLFGTPESCLEVVRQLKMAGVDEIACQMDFGIDIELVLQSLPSLNLLKERCQPETPPEPTPASQSSSSQSVRSTFASSVQERESFSPVQQSNPLQEIQQRCQQEIFPLAFYSSLQAHGVQLAESFRGIEQLWSGNGEALGRIQIPSTLEKEIDAYQIHPTLLDACFQVLIAALPIQMDANGEGTLYLPTALRSFRVHHRPGRRVWSHALLSSNADPSASSFEGDVCLLDDTGQLLVEARGLLLQRSELSVPSRHQDDLSDWLYELRWEPKSLETTAGLSTERSQRWLLFIDSSGVGQQLANLLAAQGDSCIKVVPGYTYQVVQQGKHYRINPSQPEHMHRLLKDVQTSGAFYGVVHLWSLDTTSSHETTVATLETDSALGAGSALSLIQALAALQQSRQPRLWFVTQGAQPVGPGPSSLQVGQSPLWGLGRTCAIEHPELWGGLVDVDPHERADASAKPLLTVLSSEHGDDQIAFRQGQSYVARMVRSTNWARRLLELHADASYLITGGLWGLGFEVARWMARKGARHLVLLGRSQLPPRTSWDSVNPESRTARQIAGIRELEASGVQVHYASVDVADEEQLRALLQTLRDQHIPAVRGIIHAASVWQDAEGQSLVRPLIHLNPAALKAVFQPKVMGSWLLYKLFQDTKLDFFVSFSSGASLFGSAAQGNYAAAGAFLDALAHHMRAGGQPALSIDWGAVSETGFGATPEGLRVHEYWESHGIQRITPKHVLAALELLIPQNTSQVGVLKLDWRLLLQFYPQLAQLPLVSALTTEFTDGRVPRETVHAESTLLEKLAPREHAERQQLIEAYLCEKVAGVLRLAPAKIDVQQPLTVLGLDSLMAIELKNRIELELQVHIPIVTFLQGPSIQQFAAQLLNQLAEMTPIPSASSRSPAGESAELSAGSPLAPMRQDEAEQLLTQAEQLSGDEVRALLSALSQQEQTGATDGLSRADAAQLLAQLDQLSDSEVDALLKHIVQEEGLDR